MMKKSILICGFAFLAVCTFGGVDFTPKVKLDTTNALRQYQIPKEDQSRNALQVQVKNQPWSCKVSTNAKPMNKSSGCRVATPVRRRRR